MEDYLEEGDHSRVWRKGAIGGESIMKTIILCYKIYHFALPFLWVFRESNMSGFKSLRSVEGANPSYFFTLLNRTIGLVVWC